MANIEQLIHNKTSTPFYPRTVKEAVVNSDGSCAFDTIEAEIGYLNNNMSNKVDVEAGKALSTNDFTDAYKSKLDNLTGYDDSALVAKIEALENRINQLEALGLSVEDGKVMDSVEVE